MASKVAVVREAIYGALGTVPDLRCYRYEVDGLQPPGAIVQFPAAVARLDQPGKWVMTVPVLVFVQRSSDRTADAQLEGLVDDIVDVFEADPNLDGTIDSAQFEGAEGYNLLQIGDVGYLAVTLRFEVIA